MNQHSDHRPKRREPHAPTAAGKLTRIDPHTVAEELFTWSQRLVGVDGAIIHMATEEGLEATWIQEGGNLSPDDRVLPSDDPGPVARAHRYATTQIVAEEADRLSPVMRAFAWRSAVCVPLVVDEAVIGVFSAGWRAPFPVSDEVRLILEAAASLGASVLDRMGLLHHLKQEQQRLREVLESLPVAASIIEIDTLRVRWRNNRARQLLGDVNADRAHRSTGPDNMGLIDGSVVATPDARRSLLRGETRTGRVRLRTASGQWRVLAPTIAQIDQATSVVIHVDVTHDAHMDQERSRFVHMVSHQLRTPLTPLIGYTHLLADGELDDVTRDEAAAAMTSSVNHLSHLVSRLEQIASLRPIDPLGMGRHTIGHLISRAWEALGAVDDNLLLVTGPTERQALCAEDHVVGALTELFINALSHGLPPIDVSVSADTDVHVRISDAGDGIPPAWERAVFVPFLSAEEGFVAPNAGHVGLGLSLARGLILATGGELTYSDQAFWLRLKGIEA